ncbi:MAG TPA: hypothetical protein VLB44_01200 [Kofleriaceae bacterium]|nr:hypothetical protein [Kofleriaceae bacterium]
MSTDEHLTELGPDVVVHLARAILGGQITEAQSTAIRRVVANGRVAAGKGPGATPAAVLLALDRVELLSIVAGSPNAGPTFAVVGPRLAEACNRAWVHRHTAGSPIERALVVEYLAALDALRELSVCAPTSGGGKVLRGQAAARVKEAAQHCLDEAEQALRLALR